MLVALFCRHSKCVVLPALEFSGWLEPVALYSSSVVLWAVAFVVAVAFTTAGSIVSVRFMEVPLTVIVALVAALFMVKVVFGVALKLPGVSLA